MEFSLIILHYGCPPAAKFLIFAHKCASDCFQVSAVAITNLEATRSPNSLGPGVLVHLPYKLVQHFKNCSACSQKLGGEERDLPVVVPHLCNVRHIQVVPSLLQARIVFYSSHK